MEKLIDAHSDTIKALCEVPSQNGFASSAADKTIKLWSQNGTQLAEFKGHLGAVTSLCVLDSGEIVSGSTDGTVKVWETETANCKQTIELPDAVWAVIKNKKGDLVMSCDDYIHTFTKDRRRQSCDQIKTSGVKSCIVDKQVSIEITKAQQEIKGAVQGEIRVFQDKGVDKVYMWQSALQKWN